MGRSSATVFSTAGVFPVFASSFVRVPLPGRTLVFYGLLVMWGAAAWQVVPAPAIVRRAASIPEGAEGPRRVRQRGQRADRAGAGGDGRGRAAGLRRGRGALMFGSRRGMVIIGASLGTLIFLGSVKGIVA